MTETGSLISDLGSRDGSVRERAREALVEMGCPAVQPLIAVLTDRRQQVRWEAAKALSVIAHPSSADVLTMALEDKDFDVRWLAAMGLIAIGREAVLPVLRRLVSRSASTPYREGAHHVIHDTLKRHEELGEPLGPVLVSLEDPEAPVEAPLAAERAIAELTGL